MKHKILSMGTMYLDLNCLDFPFGEGLVPNREVVGDQYEAVPGGSALIFSCVAASLGLKPVFVGKIGRDEIGTTLKKLLSKRGVSTSLIESSNVQTNIGLNFIDENSNSVMATVGSANQSMSAREVEKKISEELGSIEYLYFGGSLKLKFLLPRLKSIATRAKSLGVKIVLDHGRVTNKNTAADLKIIRELVPLVDFYLPSRDEFLKVWNAPTIETGIKKVSQKSHAQIVVKDAQKGAVSFENGKFFQIPAFDVKVKNTVGAGDSFNAGFLKAQEMKLNHRESIRFASASAAVKISSDGFPTLAKIKKILCKNSCI
jgi:sugar/nucleoside kinase (ribokinase family)